MRYGILITRATASKAVNFLVALQIAAPKGVQVDVSSVYQDCDVLVLYGLGGADRQPIAEHHRSLGKPFVAWDIGYWDRSIGKKFRFSVNSNHPDNVMDGPLPPIDRLVDAHLAYGDVADPDGPIMLVGNSPKSNNFGADGWAARKSLEIRKAFPGTRIVYRPKPNRPMDQGVTFDDLSGGPIDKALRGISLVVCRHSNVAVDACRMGVPVVCDDGAAKAIYPQQLQDRLNQPGKAVRMEFLQRLAWWQWSAGEARQAWDFMQGKL